MALIEKARPIYKKRFVTTSDRAAFVNRSIAINDKMYIEAGHFNNGQNEIFVLKRRDNDICIASLYYRNDGNGLELSNVYLYMYQYGRAHQENYEYYKLIDYWARSIGVNVGVIL